MKKFRNLPPRKFSGRLPNGKYSHSVENYIRAWRTTARPVGKLIGGKLYGFDPRVSWLLREGKGAVFDLPIWFIQLLNPILEQHFRGVPDRTRVQGMPHGKTNDYPERKKK
jgi:hypothetical protein